MRSRTKFYKDSKGEWRWNIVAGNGEIIASSSEGFTRKLACQKNYRLVRDAMDSEVDLHREEE